MSTIISPNKTSTSLKVPSQKSPIVSGTLEKKQIKLRVALQMFNITLKKAGSLFKAIEVIKKMRAKYQRAFGETMLTKVAKVDDRCFWRLGAPGFPSKASYKMQSNEANRFFSEQNSKGLRTLFIAITKKCPLRCEHCFEWENLNQEDTLTTKDIIDLVHKYQDYGTTQIMLSGGEPMLRVNDIYKVLDAAKEETDFWIITSGLGLTKERAKKLKAKGLTGVMVSLDHFLPEKHNQFRGFESAFQNAINAVVNANQAGLVTTLSLCATKSFITENNLAAYMDLAKELGVSFVQLIEPKAVGGYKGKDVELEKMHYELLEDTFLKYNSELAFQQYPIVNYLNYHQRRIGCFGGGDRFFYIDTDGYAHLCPFCSSQVSSALEFSAEDTIDLLTQYSCHSFSLGDGF